MITRGKVRDVYAVGDDQILLVATDRVSAFDVVLNQGIPDKGRLLTALSAFWFTRTASVVPNHLITADDALIFAALMRAGVDLNHDLRAMLAGRSLLCRRARPLPIEAVVRGYLSGSAWNAYQNTAVSDGTVDLWGVLLPAGLSESERLPEPVFTPSTKATAGHDEPMPQNEIVRYIGDWAEPVRATSLALYEFASAYAQERGLVVADTKFEFGVDEGGALLLIDEALTPDSSRFWPASSYQPGHGQPSFDKQFVRDYLLSVPGWNKQAPAPDLPDAVIEKTAAKYREAYRLLTGESWQ